MFTDRDMRDQLVRYLDASGFLDDYDVPAIVSDLQAAYGTVDLDAMDSDGLHRIIARHDVSVY